MTAVGFEPTLDDPGVFRVPCVCQLRHAANNVHKIQGTFLYCVLPAELPRPSGARAGFEPATSGSTKHFVKLLSVPLVSHEGFEPSLMGA